MPRVVALFRQSSYSPAQHRTNDTAILEDTLAHLVARGWSVERMDEAALAAGAAVPAGAALYLSMCQGPETARLLPLEDDPAPIVNRPSGVLACHRHRLVPAMRAAGLPFPATAVIEIDGPGGGARAQACAVVREADGARVWIKRGDVHAESADDVVAVPAAEVADAVRAFAGRGIGRVALQADVPGPVLKFYGVMDADGGAGFFRWYDAVEGAAGPRPAVDEARLRELAFGAARALGLAVFGGDAALPAPDAPVLIDVNDWPSFAPFRGEAAAAIAAYALGVSAPARAVAHAATDTTDEAEGGARRRAYGGTLTGTV